MSQTASAIDVPASARHMNLPRIVIAVALISFASLLLELAMTRLFSVVLFYHLAFFAISVALLGLGSGGVFAHIWRSRRQTTSMDVLAGRLCTINSLCILAALEVVLHTPVALEVSWHNFGRLSIIYLATAVPFFFTGLLFSTLFARSSQLISQLYGADLVGGSIACLAVVPLLNTIGAPNALLAASLAMALAGTIWAGAGKLRFIGLIVAAGFAL